MLPAAILLQALAVLAITAAGQVDPCVTYEECCSSELSASMIESLCRSLSPSESGVGYICMCEEGEYIECNMDAGTFIATEELLRVLDYKEHD